MAKITESLIIGYDKNDKNKDATILIVGKKELNKPMTVINAFEGKEAEALYKKLTTKKEKK